MEQDILNEPLLKERSYVKSITAGMRLPLRHPWGFLRHLWPLLLFNTLLWALVSKWVATHLWAFCQIAFSHGVSASELVGAPLLSVLGWGLLAFAILGLWAGQTCFLMRRFAELNYLPAVQPWKIWRDIMPLAIQGCLVFVLGHIVAAALALLCLLVLSSRIWAFCLFCLLIILWAIFYCMVGTRFLMASGTVKARLQGSFSGLRHMGGWSAIVAVCGILLITILLVGSAPVICTTYVGGLSDVSVAIGDGTDVPSSFDYLRAASFALTFLIAPIAWMFLLVPLCFKWGSEAATAVTNVQEEAS